MMINFSMKTMRQRVSFLGFLAICWCVILICCTMHFIERKVLCLIWFGYAVWCHGFLSTLSKLCIMASDITGWLDSLFSSLFKLISKKNIRALIAGPLWIHWWLVDFPHKKPVSRKSFPCHDIITLHKGPAARAWMFFFDVSLNKLLNKQSSHPVILEAIMLM